MFRRSFSKNKLYQLFYYFAKIGGADIVILLFYAIIHLNASFLHLLIHLKSIKKIFAHINNSLK
jgi:hypothetical protein